MDDADRKGIQALASEYVDELHAPALTYKPMAAARLLGIDKRTVLQLIRDGRLKATKVNERVILIPRTAIYEFLGLEDPISPAELEAAAR